jgi:tetraacyldisaccharide 4'-kinase
LPVVVVGNISVGGTGKTPVIIWLVQQLLAKGLKPVVISRGYGRRTGETLIVVTPEHSAHEVGDEPLLISRLTGCPVVVAGDRVAAAKVAGRGDADVILSDDGLQHYRLQRTLEIVVVDGQRGVGNGHLLPAGPLREPVQRLENVAAILINGPASSNCNGIAGIHFALEQQAAVNMRDGSTRELVDFAGLSVWSVAGVGNPERFHAGLRSLGLAVDVVDIPDHGEVDLVELQRIKAQPILMTSKDAVKYTAIESESLWEVPATLTMPSAAAASLLDMIVAQVASERKKN